MAVVALPAPTDADEGASETESARRAGGPQDQALYQCCCGSVFTAEVSTSVDCPSCGGDQAW